MKGEKMLSPREAWRQHIGGIQSRNSFVSNGTRLYIGTCGDVWNVRDRNDGVYCLSRADGEIQWFTPTTADVNELCLAGSSILAPTDAGDVFVLNAMTGDIEAVYRADSAVLGKPLVIDSVGGWSAIFASLAGTIYLIGEHSRDLHPLGEISGGIRASLVSLSPSEFVAATEDGRLVKGLVRDRELLTHELASAPPDTQWGDPVSFTAAPVLAGNKLYGGYARSTYGDHPAVFCFDLKDDRIEWVAKAEVGVGISFGNVRTTPALIGDKLVVASAYTEGVDIIEARTGKFVQRVVLGQNVFQQWSSPVPAGSDRIALGRIDGVCSVIDVVAGSLVAAISLETAETERLAELNKSDEYSKENFALYPGEPAPDGAICGTPYSDDGMLFAGTTNGVVIGVQLEPKSTYH